MEMLIYQTVLNTRGNLRILNLRVTAVSNGLTVIATKDLGGEAVWMERGNTRILKMEMYFKGFLKGTITITRTNHL